MTATTARSRTRSTSSGMSRTADSMPSEVSASKVQALPEGSYRLLDVRSSSEFRTCHIPGAVNVPLDQVSRYRDQIVAADEPVVLVCQQGARAKQAQDKLAEAGGDGFHVLIGGMVAWQQAEGAVVKGEQRWGLERQVRLVAGLIVLLSILGSLVVPGLKFVAGFVGAGLTFAAVSNTCMMGNLLARLPYNRGSSRDIERAVASFGPA
mgnify:CR=1 FL=1